MKYLLIGSTIVSRDTTCSKRYCRKSGCVYPDCALETWAYNMHDEAVAAAIRLGDVSDENGNLITEEVITP